MGLPVSKCHLGLEFSQVEAALLGEDSLGIHLMDLEAAGDTHLWGRPQCPMGAYKPRDTIVGFSNSQNPVCSRRAWLKPR